MQTWVHCKHLVVRSKGKQVKESMQSTVGGSRIRSRWLRWVIVNYSIWRAYDMTHHQPSIHATPLFAPCALVSSARGRDASLLLCFLSTTSAHRCWASDPPDRPSANELVATLMQLLMESLPAAPDRGAGTSGSRDRGAGSSGLATQL